jgi:hypothetical protein
VCFICLFSKVSPQISTSIGNMISSLISKDTCMILPSKFWLVISTHGDI